MGASSSSTSRWDAEYSYSPIVRRNDLVGTQGGLRLGAMLPSASGRATRAASSAIAVGVGFDADNEAAEMTKGGVRTLEERQLRQLYSDYVPLLKGAFDTSLGDAQPTIKLKGVGDVTPFVSQSALTTRRPGL